MPALCRGKARFLPASAHRLQFAEIAPQDFIEPFRVEDRDAFSRHADELPVAETCECARQRLAHGAEFRGEHALGAVELDFQCDFWQRARAALTRVSALLQEWFDLATEQLKPTTVWVQVCDHLKQILACIDPPKNLKLLTNFALGSG